MRNQPLANHQWQLIVGVLRDSRDWRICLWLRRNGIDPRTVPDDADIFVEGDRIFYEEFSDDFNRWPTRSIRVVPLLVPPPPGGFRWS